MYGVCVCPCCGIDVCSACSALLRVCFVSVYVGCVYVERLSCFVCLFVYIVRVSCLFVCV